MGHTSREGGCTNEKASRAAIASSTSSTPNSALPDPVRAWNACMATAEKMSKHDAAGLAYRSIVPCIFMQRDRRPGRCHPQPSDIDVSTQSGRPDMICYLDLSAGGLQW